jgi:hypothetical protein
MVHGALVAQLAQQDRVAGRELRGLFEQGLGFRERAQVGLL